MVMCFQHLASVALVLFASCSLAEHIPQNHILWGAAGPPGATLIKRATSTTSTAASSTSAVADSACTNSPKSRNCWGPAGYSVSTDFDAKWPNTGKTVSYNLEITNTTCNPDGYASRTCLLVNNQYPGPLIQANWGDTLSVTVKNSMQDNGTGIHWHGIRQLGTVQMDGTSGITECPLAPGQTKTYIFKCTQFGTTWYHSHFSAQYGDGVMGPVVINGPTSANYDIDLGPYMVNDWYYPTSFQVSVQANNNLQKAGGPPPADTVLINGTNKNANGGGAYSHVSMTQGKKYLLRLINPSTDNFIRVSLDNHPFTVVTTDLVPIKPYTTNWILLGIGQRYEVIITANQTVGNYWFRAEAESSCVSSNNFYGRSIFSYVGATAGDPTSTGATKPGGCNDEAPLVPWVLDNVPSDQFTSQAKSLQFDLLVPGVNTNNQNIVTWGINASAIDIDWEMPTLSYVQQGNTNYPTALNLIEIPNEGIWTYWIVQETGGAGTLVPIPHPIHLHGHDYYVLGQGTGTFGNSSISSLNFNNPVRRDTATLPASGWLVMAFPSDNPGSWLMHCHIAWHIGAGLGVQFLESKSTIPAVGGDYNSVCSSWKSYYDNKRSYNKTDSGL